MGMGMGERDEMKTKESQIENYVDVAHIWKQ